MKLRHRPTVTAIGVLVFAVANVAALRAQTTTTEAPQCPSAVDELSGVEIETRVLAPVDPAKPSASATVPIDVTFENRSERRRVVTDPAPRITEIRARIYACRSWQLLPEPSTAEVLGPAARSMSISLDPVFETNGPYTVEFRVSGDRTGTPPQVGRYVMAITLAVAPKKPTGVEATVSGGNVTVSWSNADAEKDLIAYEVRRARQGSADYTTVTDGLVDPSVNSVSDTPPEGAWRYHVVAYRSGVDEGSASADTTAEVAAPAPTGPTAAPGGDASASSSGSGAIPPPTTVAGTRPSATSPTAAADLAKFAAALNARRAAGRRVEPPDPGFTETLPFQVPPDELGEPEGTALEEPEELGVDEPNVGLGQRVISDPGERRRSLSFVAFGLLLFVLSMTGLFVKSEVKRADLLDVEHDLDVVDADLEVEEPKAPEPQHHFAELLDPPSTVASSASRATARRARRTVTPLDAPGLDVPEPVATTTRTTRTATNARRTPPRLPPRPANDRRQGRAAVRPGRRGAGQGDGRVPVRRS